MHANTADGVTVEHGARAELWGSGDKGEEAGIVRQNQWCGVRVSGEGTSARVSQLWVGACLVPFFLLACALARSYHS